MEEKSGYSAQQIAAMQRDAVRRVNEMQRIAREKVAAPQQDIAAEPPSTPQPNIPIHQQSPAAQGTPLSAANHGLLSIVQPNFFSGILDKLNLDTETIMLMLLIFVLLNEGSDNILILALVYILI